MRRKYISPEFKYVSVNGCLNMKEQTSIFGSKMIDIQDQIVVSSENIIYYQSQNNEQVNFLLEKNSDPLVYNTNDDKNNNHTIVIDESQSLQQSSSNTKWVVNINIDKILSNYLFATFKKFRTFEGVKNNMTLNNNVNSSINEYISKNILNRYKYKSIDFYIEYTPLSNDGSIRYKNFFSEISDPSLLEKKIQTLLSDDQKILKVLFTQSKTSALFNYNYYYNITFDKI